MNKFERVLSNEDLLDVYRSLDNPKRDRDSVIEAMGAAVEVYKEKLAEQEPVAWRVTAKSFCGDTTKHKDTAEYWEEKEPGCVIPLYAHPCVAPVSDKPGCVSEKGESDTKHHLSYLKRYQKWRRGEDKTMDEAGLTPKRIGETLDWLITFAENHIPDTGKMVFDPDAALTLAERTLNIEITEPIADEIVQFARKLHEKYTQADHIPDASKMMPQGWQLVPVEPTQEMVQAADKSDEEYSKRNFNADVRLCQSGYDHYITMLAAAPKYTGGSNE